VTGGSSESALVILAPEVEDLVKPFRDRYDPAARDGMRAHMTLVYPFVAPPRLTATVLDSLGDLFSRLSPFTVSLARLCRFPDVLYLAPVPDAPIRQLIEAIVERFPDTPPYGGAHSHVVPHLTIARLTEHQRLDDVAAEFQRAAASRLPVTVSISDVALMDTQAGSWQVRATFGLGRAGACRP
jgi:2'-5' RNA ligase